MTRIWGVVALGAAVACGGSKPAAKGPRRELELWDLAPPGTYLAIGARYGDWWDLPARAEAAMKDAPAGEQARAFVAGPLSYRHVNLRSRKARQAAGVDDDAPRVAFWSERGRIWAYRVVDRAAYNRTYLVRPDRASRGRMTIDRDGDTCAQIERWQVCGTRELLADLLDGKRRSIAWPAGDPPTVRVWVAPSALGGLAGVTEGGDGLRVEIDVGHGELHARGHLSGKTAGLLALFSSAGPSPLARRLPARELSGAAVLNLIGWFERTRQIMMDNVGDERITAKVSTAELIGALRGDASMWVVRGDRSGGIAIGLEKTDVARRLLADCEELGDLIPGLTIARAGATCRLRHEALAEVGTGEIVVSVKDDALVAEMTGKPPAGASPQRAAAGGRMLERVRAGDDGLSMWGVGLLALMVRSNLANRTSKPHPFHLWLLLQVTETGGSIRVDPDGIRGELAIRTTAAYEDAAQAALAPILARLARSEDVGAESFSKLAAAHPQSRLADDIAHGSTGSIVPLLAGFFVGVAGAQVAREFSAAAEAGKEVVSAYEDVVDKACRCKDAECAERAVERHEAWEARHGETVVDTLSLARIGDLTREYETCLAPFFSDGE